MSDRVVVVGGGIAGCAIARELAPAFTVDVIERGQIASGATGRAAGEITMPAVYTDYPAIGNHAFEFFREYDGTGEFEFTECRSVELVDVDRAEEAERRAERLAEHGFRWLDRSAAEATYPRFDLSAFAGVVETPRNGFVDPYTFATTLRADAEAEGAAFHTHTEVTGIETADGRVSGVRTDAGRVDADFVVAAAGWRTRQLLGGLIEIPIHPYRTQCVVLRPEPPLSGSFPMGFHPDEHVYFRAERSGDLLVGGFSFAESDPENASRDADEAFRTHVAELIPTFLEGFDDASFVDGWAGVDAATPDTRPIVDAPADAPDGLVVATGFHGRGIMTAPVTATVVHSLVSGEPAPFPTTPFALDRFEDRSDEFEFTSISSE